MGPNQRVPGLIVTVEVHVDWYQMEMPTLGCSFLYRYLVCKCGARLCRHSKTRCQALEDSMCMLSCGSATERSVDGRTEGSLPAATAHLPLESKMKSKYEGVKGHSSSPSKLSSSADVDNAQMDLTPKSFKSSFSYSAISSKDGESEIFEPAWRRKSRSELCKIRKKVHGDTHEVNIESFCLT